ncbi:MAG: phosphotransferase [Deltaproteobacteria bacterium]|nr:phosphotransferase [Deltaproteobacteria bacterium]
MSTPDSPAGGLGPVREAHRFDEAALGEFARRHVPGFEGPLVVQQFEGGQSNPTFLLQTPGRQYILRKKPPGQLLPSAHAIEREYRILKALEPTGVPVPKVHVLCEDPAVIGTPFYVMERVEGRIFRNPTMPEARSPDERRGIYLDMARVLARIHKVDWKAAGLEGYGKTGNYMLRQIERWTAQYEATRTDTIDSMEKLIRWMPDNVPDAGHLTIAHGDYRLENLIIHPQEPHAVAVLDWELSTLGHPLADLAYCCMLYHLPPNPSSGNLGASSGLMGTNFVGLGIPPEKDFISAYAAEMGDSGGVADYDFFVAFGMFRLAAIVQGVYKRGLDGNASSTKAATYGPIVKFLADAAMHQLKGRL